MAINSTSRRSERSGKIRADATYVGPYVRSDRYEKLPTEVRPSGSSTSNDTGTQDGGSGGAGGSAGGAVAG